MTNTPILTLARELGERLGGPDSGCGPVERAQPVASVRPPNFNRWPEHVRAEMEAIWKGEIA